MRPKDVTKDHEELLLNSVYNYTIKLCKPKYKIGDFVRVSHYHSVFDKGYRPQWSPAIFKIVTISRKAPVTYVLQDFKGELLKGRMYESEIQPVKYKDGYLIEKILQKKNNKLLCKWWGFAEPTWEDEKNVV